ncbi:hypothetical protein DLJ53_10545 [Acuticoccus sediminis]|uniref:DUF5624 domain-containing protein n=1 Tax=Acuticoccus sediminis TaxID=2184697 RepID=A0A8B2NPM3_9HYPH|nr:DUF5624 domain-containing protein [Acuticoccus sediminis]RAI01836.1 hypothetical protein DLJ53_10545 [Acuticoccus sediminis]
MPPDNRDERRPGLARAPGGHTPGEAAQRLFDIYPGSRPASIARVLTETLQAGARAGGGSLVLYTGSGLYVYDRSSRALIAGIGTRTMRGNGNYELTAVSHIGPAIAYLATMRAAGGDEWRRLAEALMTRIDDFRGVNAASDWLGDADAPALAGRTGAVRDMIDYACRLSTAYLAARLAGDGSDFTPDDARARYFTAGMDGYPIGFDNVMVATFALAVLQDAHAIASGLRAAAADGRFDWSDTRIVVFQLVGNNYGAGLTARTNWGIDLLMRLGGADLDPGRIFVAPYIDRRDDVGADPLPEAAFTYYDQAWQGIRDRLDASNAAFADIRAIEPSAPPAIPGDWGATDADDIEAFVRRLKYTFGTSDQLLSNATGFWVAGALEAAGWDPTRVRLPGFDTGFPPGIRGYPPTRSGAPDG